VEVDRYLKTQFLHEHHNRQDKARKPDYKEGMIAKGCSEAAPTPSARLCARADARARLILEIRKRRFVYRGLDFRFGWDLEVFARKNKLPLNDDKTIALMEEVRRVAQSDLDAFAERIKIAEMHKRGGCYYFNYERPETNCEIL